MYWLGTAFLSASDGLERGLLAPFQYFGIADNTDLKTVRWKRGRGYEPKELENVYTGDDARARIIAQAVKDKVTSIRAMRAIGFCVGVAHARFMADRFNGFGIPSIALTGEDHPEQRRAAIDALRSREVNVLFTVDLFNEGVDIPEVDTVLFLRPTESATVFLQQLGRGLRLAGDKPCLTVLDFIGAQNANFRFDLRYRALTGASRRGLMRRIEHGFPTLPAGCHISLDRVSAELVLENVRVSLRIDWKGLVSELRNLGDVDVGTFVKETGVELDDINRRRHGGWAGLRRQAGFDDRKPGPDDVKLASSIGRMLHIDDQERLRFIAALLGSPVDRELPQLDTREGTEAHFSPTTMYNDRAITPSLFQWESQSTTSEASHGTALHPSPEAGIHHPSVCEGVESNRRLSGNATLPVAGEARYVSHTGDRPMRIKWKLEQDLPADTFLAARVAAG